MLASGGKQLPPMCGGCLHFQGLAIGVKFLKPWRVAVC